MIWVAALLLVGQGLIAIVLLRIMTTFGVYAESLLATHHQNVEIRKNLAIQENEHSIDHILKREKHA